jgi:hypothetical protein
VFFRFGYVNEAKRKGKVLLLQIFGNPNPSFYNCIHFLRPKQISGFYQFGKKPSFKRTKLKLIGYTFQNLHSGALIRKKFKKLVMKTTFLFHFWA